MSICAPCRRIDDSENPCLSCPLTNLFTTEDDLYKLSVLARTYSVQVLRQKVLDLVKTCSSVSVWVEMELVLLSKNQMMENRIADLEVEFRKMKSGDGDEDKKTGDEDKKTGDEDKKTAPTKRRDPIPFSADEFETLLKGLEQKIQEGLEPNDFLWENIRSVHFDRTIRTSGDLKDIWRRSENCARNGQITASMKAELFGRVIAVSKALEVWRQEKVAATEARKAAKEAKKAAAMAAKAAAVGAKKAAASTKAKK